MFRRGPKTDAASAAADGDRSTRALAALEGPFPCTEPGCDNHTGVGCQYVDRRCRGCPSAWCPKHRLIVNGWTLCRRHAGVIRALADVWTSGVAMPDLNNRAPSLVHWVARTIDAEVRALLRSEAGDGPGQIVADPVSLTFMGRDRKRVWERAWKLLDHTGHTLRVALAVEEDGGNEIIVKVNSHVLGELIPPWIDRRLRDPGVTPEEDQLRRQEFSRQLLEMIRRGLDWERAVALWSGPRPLYWPR